MKEQEMLDNWKNEGMVIGYISNDFDNITMESIQLLIYASQNCDKLIVGLDTDYAIKLKHSINKPKNEFHYRKQVLEMMEYADMILPIEEVNSYNIIESVSPHKIFMKTNEPCFHKIKELIESYNGELFVLDSVYIPPQLSEKNEKAIITGLDHVLVDLSAKMPNYNNLYLMNALHKEGYKILVVTCKSESDRRELEKWLSKYIHIDKMFMRVNNVTNTAKIKEEIYTKYIEHDYDIDFVFDADKENCEMWKKYGLNCMHIMN